MAIDDFGLINGYSLIVNERGNVIPLLDIVPTDTTNHLYIPITSWYEVDIIQPRIGNVVKLTPGKYSTEISPHFVNVKAEALGRPKKCPLCESELKVSGSDATVAYSCSNKNCGYYQVLRLLRFLRYCCLCQDFTYTSVYKLYVNKVLRNLEDIYSLTKDNLVRAGYSPELASILINEIDANREIPIQNLYYALMPESKPIHALRLASLIRNKWYNPITETFTTGIIPTRLVTNGEILSLVVSLNSYLTNNKASMLELNNNITVTTSVSIIKPSLSGRTFIIGNLDKLKVQHLKTMIKLNGGSVEENVSSSMFWNIDYAVTNGIETNKNVINAINYGALAITEDEVRVLINVPIGNEPSFEELEKTKKSLGIYRIPNTQEE